MMTALRLEYLYVIITQLSHLFLLFLNSSKANYKIGMKNDGNKETHKQRQRIKQDVMGRTRQMLTEPLLSNGRGYTYRHTDWWEQFMKYAIDVGSVALMYVQS
jgi:hypothetical protein